MGRISVRGFSAGAKKINNIVDKSTFKTMTNAMKDLERVASETAPLDEGDLELGGFHGVDKTGTGVQGWVGFEAFNKNPNAKKWKNFNYAIWIHEKTYKLGPISKMKSGGKGLSGKTYPVQKKYLTRPHEGESPTYRLMIQKDLKTKLQKAK